MKKHLFIGATINEGKLVEILNQHCPEVTTDDVLSNYDMSNEIHKQLIELFTIDGVCYLEELRVVIGDKS